MLPTYRPDLPPWFLTQGEKRKVKVPPTLPREMKTSRGGGENLWRRGQIFFQTLLNQGLHLSKNAAGEVAVFPWDVETFVRVSPLLAVSELIACFPLHEMTHTA